MANQYSQQMLIYKLLTLIVLPTFTLINSEEIRLPVSYQSSPSPSSIKSNQFNPGGNQVSQSVKRKNKKTKVIDEIRTIDQLIVDYGYGYELNYITTDDGYILSIYSVHNPCLTSNDKQSNLNPIILGHPISQDGSIFIDGSPIYNQVNCSTGKLEGPLNKNLAFTLADLGFTVHLPSFRGFRNSRNHTIYDPQKDKAYWDFSIDEIGKFDCPAIVDFVLNKTIKSQKVIWIGHSFGFAVPLVLLTTNPVYQFKFEHIIGLAPAVYLTHTSHPSTRFLADSGLVNKKKFDIGPEPEQSIEERQYLIKKRTSKDKIRKLSQQFYHDFGYDPMETNVTRLPVFYSQSTQTSISTYVQFAQLALSQHFKAFDGGRNRNLRKYGSPKPPTYKLSTIRNVTFTIMASPNDKVVAFRDAVKLVNSFKVPVNFKPVKYKKLNHYGFLWAVNRDKIVNNEIITTLNRYTTLAYNVSTESHS